MNEMVETGRRLVRRLQVLPYLLLITTGKRPQRPLARPFEMGDMIMGYNNDGGDNNRETKVLLVDDDELILENKFYR